ncbi:MAG: arylesterase [Proteobacteria bacterium]|nr:MAG: arylesterase [Pseudomonadota bacterium]
MTSTVDQSTTPVTRSWRAALLTIAIMLVGCADDRTAVGPLPDNAVILAFGDSITYGTGVSTAESYPAQLARLTGFEVVNAGVPGETADQGLVRLPALLDEFRPDLVVLCHGGNDILRNRPESRTEQDLRRMVEVIRGSGARVLLIGVPRKSLFLATAPVYARVAEELDVPFVDDVLADVLGNGDLKSDAVHPNAAGYRTIAERIAEAVE